MAQKVHFAALPYLSFPASAHTGVGIRNFLKHEICKPFAVGERIATGDKRPRNDTDGRGRTPSGFAYRRPASPAGEADCHACFAGSQ